MAEYGVNIKISANTSKLDLINKKTNQLASAVDKVNAINLNDITSFKGEAGQKLKKTKDQLMGMVSQVNATNKAFGLTIEQQEGALQGFEALRRSMTVGTKDFNIVTEAINKQTKAMQEQNKQFGINQKKQRNPRGNQAALQSGLISGAFPMLFGQGILGGAAGFAGGFAGTKLGGQMGGFAGGLVATAVLQQLTTLASNMAKLGKAFDELNPNVQAVTSALGLAGSVEEKRLLLIEKTHGAHVALNMVTEQMNQAIGEQGVQNLTEFAEASRLAGNQFKLAMTKIQAAIAPFMSMFLVDAQRAENTRLANLTGDKQLADMRSELETLEGTTVKGRSANKNRQDRINQLKSEILAREELLAKTGKGIELEKLRNQQFDSATKSLEDQNMFLQNQLLLGQQGAEIEKLKLETAKRMRIAVKDLAPEQVKQLENLIKTRDQLQKINDLYSSIGSTIESGLVNAIQGAIDGTKSLGDVARSVFGEISRQLISFGVNAFLGSLFPGSSFFRRANGGPVSSGRSYMVGERGPEMFVPNTSGRIVPNSDMGSSTNVVVNVDASGSSVQGDEEQGRELGRIISVAVQSELIQQKRPGGLLA